GPGRRAARARGRGDRPAARDPARRPGRNAEASPREARVSRALVVATGNPGKLAEFTEALRDLPVEILGLDALSPGDPIEETGETFEENALLKAEGYSRRTPHLVLADDSGLEVLALGGAQGVRSASYGGPSLTDANRCDLVLRAMRDVPDRKRTARFRCVLALAQGGRTIETFPGVAEGTILRAPLGANGFGYDPIFFYPPLGRSFAELTPAEKEAVSHRGHSASSLKAFIRTSPLFAATS